MPDNTLSSLSRKSPLARFWGGTDHAVISADSVSVTELPFQGVIKLQCRNCSPQFLAAVKSVLSVELPQVPNTRVGESPVCLWVAPNEWLLITPAGDDAALAEQLSQHLAQSLPEDNVAVTLISDSRTVLEITGAAAVELIAKGCGLDLHPEQFNEGQCAVSLLEQIPMTLYVEKAELEYRMLVDRSYAAFAWEWLAHALKEFKYKQVD